MLVLLCARSSVELKGWRYAFGYWRHFFYFCLLMPTSVFLIIKFLRIFKFALATASVAINVLWVLFLVDFFYLIFFIAFLLDSNAGIKSFGLSLFRAGKMVVYNLPFIIVSLIFLFCLGKGVACINSFLNPDIMGYVVMILLPIPVCFFINFYIKKKHEQFDLYFPVKGK
jgi:hypothetical protein